MLNIIIDGEFFFRRSLSSTDFNPYKKADEKVFDNFRTQAIFVRKVCTDIAFQIRQYSLLPVKRILFLREGGTSWRYSLYSGYKAGRDNDVNEINWDKYSDLKKEIIEFFTQWGLKISRTETAEADDLCYLWSIFFLKNKEHSVIISSDNDLKQLIKWENNIFVIHHNIITNKVTCTQDFHDFLNESNEKKVTNIFDIDDSYYQTLQMKKELINIMGMNLNVIDPLDVVFSKIIQGDKSDNIPSACRGWGDKTIEKLTNSLKSHNKYLPLLNSFLHNKSNGLELENEMSLIKNKPQGFLNTDIQKQLVLNSKLVTLNSHHIPKEIIQDFLKQKEKILNEEIRLNITALSTMQTILEGTKYITKDYENDDSVFKNIDFNEVQRKDVKIIKKSTNKFFK